MSGAEGLLEMGLLALARELHLLSRYYEGGRKGAGGVS